MKYDNTTDITAYKTDLAAGRLEQLQGDYVIYSEGKLVTEVIGGDNEVAAKITELNLEGRCTIAPTNGIPDEIGLQ